MPGSYSAMMRVFTQVLWMLSVAWTFADGYPTKAGQVPNDSLDCHLAEDYSTEWFLENTKPEFRQPLQNNALFYSAGMSKSARRIAKENKKVTIWDVWPCYLYNHLDEGQNPLRCIHQKDKERELFFAIYYHHTYHPWLHSETK